MDLIEFKTWLKFINECAFGGNPVPPDVKSDGTLLPGWHTPLVLFGGKTILLNRAHREPVAPVADVLRTNTTTAKAQAPRITGRVERSRPVDTARTTVAPRRTIAVAGASKKQPIAIYLGL